jgi:RNA polymerase sigma factor (sigma-70 family)
LNEGVSLPPFQTFLDRHREVVYRFLAFAVGPEEAHDCAQETFLAALRAYPRLTEGSSLRAWVLTIAHRKAIDAHRARRRRPVPTAELDEGRVDPPTLPEPGLWEAVAKLPSKQRSSVVLRFVADLPFADVGAIVGCSEAAARQNVRQALIRLREEWVDEEGAR